jgi:hypothetical protein
MADFLLDDEIENMPEKTTVEFTKFGIRLRAAPHRGYRGYFRLPTTPLFTGIVIAQHIS